MAESNKRKSPVGPFRPQLQLCLTVFHTGKLRLAGKSGSAVVCRCGCNCLNLFSKHLFRASCMPNRTLATGIRGINCTWHSRETSIWWEKADVTESILRVGGVHWAKGQRAPASLHRILWCAWICIVDHGDGCVVAVRHTEAQDFSWVWKNLLHTSKGASLGKDGLCQNPDKGRMHGDLRNRSQSSQLSA